jgi:hypothetical protein
MATIMIMAKVIKILLCLIEEKKKENKRTRIYTYV